MSFELFPVTQWMNGSGNPLAGGKIYTYAAGTTTPLATYTDSTGGTPNANPMVLDAAGRGQLWLAAAAYKFVYKDASDVTQQTIDNIQMDNLSATIATLLMTGDLTLQQSTAANGSANQSSNSIKIQGNYWTGAASAVDQWTVQNVLGAGTNPTSTLTFTHTGSSGTISLSFGGAVSVKQFESIRFADQFPGADGGAKINAADADLGSAAGEIWVNQAVGLSWTTAVVISANHVLRFIQGGTYSSSASPMITLAGTGGAGGGASVIGTGTSTILQTSSGTADIIQMTGNMCYAANLTLRSSVVRTAGAGINSKGGGNYFENIEFNPVWNAVQCITAGCAIGGKNFLMRQGAASSGANNCGILLGGQTSGAVSTDMFFSQGQIADSVTYPYADAAIVLDAGLDTIRFTDVDGGSVSAPGLKMRFSGGSLDVPRLVRFTACSWECSATSAQVVEATAYKDVRFDGCVFNNALVGFHVNGSTNGNNLCVINSSFNNQQHENVLIDSGADTYFLHCNMSGASQASNGGFDSIKVAANVTKFYIDGNNFSDIFTYTNHPNYNIRVLAGTSDSYIITNNINGTVVTGVILDGGTGVNKITFPNIGMAGTWITQGTGLMQMYLNGVAQTFFGNTLIRYKSSSMMGWSSAADPVSAIADVNLTRNAAGVLQVGTGETANSLGTLALTQGINQTAQGAQWVTGQASELLTLSTSGTTTDTSANLLPANSIIEAVVARVTTTITTATDWKLGDGTISGRFAAANATMTAGATSVGTVQADQTGTSGPRQAAAAKVRVTTTGTPGAGVIRITVFYRQFVPPTS